MSAKFIHVIADENRELQKQIGCMTGIFQIFDRQHLVTSKRLIGHSKKRIPSGQASLNIGKVGAEPYASSPQVVLEKNHSKSSYENQRVSMESSRTSVSSSSCSSSSLECNRMNRSTQHDLPSFDRAVMKASPKSKTCENDSRPVIRKPHIESSNTSVQSSRHSLDFRDVVRDSIYRDAYGLSVNTSARDSPRPTHSSKSVDGSYMVGINGSSRLPVDLNESLRAMVKLKEAPWHFSEAVEPPKSSYEAKDAPFNTFARFSYDGRVISRTSIDSRENNKPTSKIRELPRLSLDSREQRSLTGWNYEMKPNFVFKDSDKRNVIQGSATINPHGELGSNKSSPSVVAKLMGLEVMANSSSAAREPLELSKSYIRKDCNFDFITKSSGATQDIKKDRLSRSPKASLKDPFLPRPKKLDSAMKPVSNSRVPVETAPWRRSGRTHAHDPQAKQPSESVYSEIEKRLKDLEFRQSNKDLRALKQILDAMQEKGLLETKRGEEPDSEPPSNGKSHSNSSSANIRNRLITRPAQTMIKGNNTPRPFQSPIVIMKPAKSISRSAISSSSIISLEGLSGLQKLRMSNPADKRTASINNRVVKAQTPKASQRELSYQPLLTEDNKARSRLQQSPRENVGGSGMTPISTLNSLSPRMQQRKLESERKPRAPLPSSEPAKPQKQSGNRQPLDSVSPRSKLRRRPSRSSESNETRNLSQKDDEASLRSDSNISTASHINIEVTSADLSADMNLPLFQQNGLSPSTKVANTAASILKDKDSSLGSKEEVLGLEFIAAVSEQPSPISVLDASFYRDELPHSPLKRSSDALEDEGTRRSDDIWNRTEIQPLKSSSKIDYKKLENIENLVRKLRDLASSDAGPPNTDYIASLCETRNPDHRYVSEVLLASGILMKDLTDCPIQLHPSGHVINPDLFLVLEQTKSGPLSKPESVHRKLVFDAVNEILMQKLGLVHNSPPINLLLWPGKLSKGFPSGQRLLRELCSEIERLEAENSRRKDEDDDNLVTSEDLFRQLEGWSNGFDPGLPGLVLEMERLIFKDLIDEVVSGKAESFSQPKSSRCRRKLFAK